MISLSRLQQRGNQILNSRTFDFQVKNSSHAHLLPPDDVHRLLLSRRGGEGGEAHYFCWVPKRLLQVAPLDVSLQVGEPQHGQVQRVSGDARQAGPLLLGSYDPIVSRVHIVLVVLKLLARRVGVRDCVGLQREKDVKTSANLSKCVCDRKWIHFRDRPIWFFCLFFQGRYDY